MDNDTYSFTVKFERSLADDLAVVGREGGHLNNEVRGKLVQQLRKELQLAYDHPDVAPAGSFNIETITIDGITYQA